MKINAFAKEDALMLSSFHARSRVVVIWSYLLLLVCSSAPRVVSAQPAGDDAAIRELVEKFFDIYQKRDLDGLMALWSEKSPDLTARKEEFRQAFAANKIQLRSVTISKIEVNEGKARVRAVAEVYAEDVKTGKAAEGFGVMNRTFRLLMEGGGWKIWQYVASEQELAAVLVAAKTDEERKAILEAEKGLVTVELVRALLSEGNRLETQGAYAVVLGYYELALNLAEQLRDPIGVASAFRNIGNIHFRQGNYTQALEYDQRSLKISEGIGYKLGIAGTLASIGDAHYAQGNYSLAREEFTKAIAAVEELRGRVAGDEQQQQLFFQTRLSPYHRMIALSVDEKKHSDAFAYAERVKGRALLDTLEAGRVNVTKAMTDNERPKS